MSPTKAEKEAAAEQEALAKIAEMSAHDREMAEGLHEIIKEVAPNLTTRLWYGMPAYAREGKVICFFQSGQKFKTRYSTFGFSDEAHLDEGAMWPAYYALKASTAETEAAVRALVEKALR